MTSGAVDDDITMEHSGSCSSSTRGAVRPAVTAASSSAVVEEAAAAVVSLDILVMAVAINISLCLYFMLKFRFK